MANRYICDPVEENTNRIIGKYVGSENGPLLICLGGMHGNEPAGVKALDLLLKMLEVEPITNPDFKFHGSIIGFRGNVQAISKGVRFIEKDLNRSLHPDHVAQILKKKEESLVAEDLEVFRLIGAIRKEIEEINPDKIVILDLHTTTAFGGVFTLTSDQPESISIGVEMHAPVLTGFDSALSGTTMSYFRPEHFGGRPMVCVVFESGQHEEALSVNRAIAATINCMRTMGCVSKDDVENRHDYLLIEYSAGLPKVAKLLSRYHVEDVSSFEMNPDYQNFQPIKKGEVLAYENGTPVIATQDGLIVMPKYQKQGKDGFFMVEEIEGY